MPRLDAAQSGCVLIRIRAHDGAVGDRDERCRTAKAVAIERRACELARGAEIDVRIQGDNPIGGDKKFHFGLTPSILAFVGAAGTITTLTTHRRRLAIPI
jgi:hypothetical protein